MVRVSVVMGAKETTPPPLGTTAVRLPAGLVTTTSVGRLASRERPSEIEFTDRLPFQRRVSEGDRSLSPAIHGVEDFTKRLSGRKRGKARSQELAEI